ncbi:MAG TPA: hypothetical protein VEB66_06385 [Opitutaceae bacterium]|nr:hypothetical protein [Opitutaceae bacterium]
MSLINDALKKAQRQRGDEPPADLPPGPGSGRVPRRDKPAGFPTLLVRLAIGVIAVCAVIATTVFLLRDKPAPVATTPPPTAPVAAVPAPKIEPEAPKTEPAAPKSDPAPVVATVPPATAPATPAVAAATPAPPGAGAAVPNVTLPPVDAPAIPAPASAKEQDKRILAYLSNLRVTGIRPSGADSKVLMNDRVYKLNDVVDYTLGLKLTGVAVQRLEFVDERGVGYVKTF